MASNDMNFLKDLIPTSVIKVITIETIGGTVLLETNPHIVEETVPVYKRAELQATMGAEGGARFERLMKEFGVDLASTSFSGKELGEIGTRMGMNTSNKETTMVTLDVAMKDTLDREDVAGQWFMSGDITKYLYIVAVQFKTKRAVDVYRQLIGKASGPVMQIVHGYLNNKITEDELLAQARKQNIPNVGTLIKTKKEISFDIRSAQDIVNAIDSSTSGEAITEQDLMLAGYSSIDTNGDTIYEFPAKFQFEIKNSEPDHAAYYVCSYIDIEKLLEDNGLTTNTVNMSANQYANNGEWVTILADGELGNDSRISDFRDVNNVVPAYSVDLSAINMLDELASGTAQNFTTLPGFKPKYFSDIHLSIMPGRACGYVFAFSQLDFMKDNSVYGRFFDNVADNIADEVLKRCTMEEIKIVRRRVKHFKQGAYARGYPNVYEPWTAGEVKHVVVTSRANKNTGKLQSTRRVVQKRTGAPTNLGRTNSGGIREIQLKTNATNGKDFKIRHFTGKDIGVKRQTDGIYQYGVEITMRDYVPVYIGNHLKRLRKHVTRLKEYETFSQIPVVNRYQQTYKEPHISNTRIDQETGKAVAVVNIVGGEATANTSTSKQTQVGFYDPTINRFTRDFRRFAARRYARTRPWRSAPRAFVQLLDLIVNNKMSDRDKLKIRRNMTSVCNPASGTPRGINAVIETLEIYIQIVENLISSEPPTSNSSGAENPNTPGGGSGVTNRTVTHQTWFNNDAFNADAPPATGASFLNMSSGGSTTSVGIVTTGDYRARANDEVMKYYTSPTSPPNVDCSYKYLSGMTANMLQPGNTVDLRVIKDYKAGGMQKSEMQKEFRTIVQWMGSNRKADQTRILTIDSQQRVGQAIAPEFGFSLMTGEEYANEIRYRKNTDSNSNPLLEIGADDGGGAEPAPLPPGIQLLADDDEEIDYIDVFPSAMATSEWAEQQSGGELIEAISSLAAGFERNHETEFLTQMIINTKRDFMHSTKNNPARDTEANFTPVALIEYLIEQASAAGGWGTPEFEEAANRILNIMPISIQAAAQSPFSSAPVRSSISKKVGAEYWNHPVVNALYQLYFMMNVRVEYLVGYRDSNLRPKYEKSIGAEIWSPVTQRVVDSLHRAEGQQILCRLRPYNHEDMRIAFPKALQMPIWNNTFLLAGNNGKALSGIRRKIGLTRPAIQVIREGLTY